MGQVDGVRSGQTFSRARLIVIVMAVQLLPPLLALVIAPVALVLMVATWLAIPITITMMLSNVLRARGRELARKNLRTPRVRPMLKAFPAH